METTDFVKQGFTMAEAIARNLSMACALFGAISLGWEYGKRLMYHSSLDWGPIVKVAALVITILAYTSVMNLFVYIGSLVEVSLRLDSLSEAVIKYNTESINQMQANLEKMESSVAAVEDAEVTSQVTNSNILICSVILFLFHFTTEGVFVLRDLLLTVVIALGPVAILLSILKVTDRSLGYWFRSLMILLVWKAVIYAGYRLIVLLPTLNGADWITTSTSMAVTISFVLGSFKIASVIVRESQTGIFHSQHFTLKN